MSDKILENKFFRASNFLFKLAYIPMIPFAWMSVMVDRSSWSEAQENVYNISGVILCIILSIVLLLMVASFISDFVEQKRSASSSEDSTPSTK